MGTARMIALHDASPRLQAPSVIGVLFVIGGLKVSLATVGFERTWRWMRAWSRRTPIEEGFADVALREAEYAVALAAALYPGRAACLERSLALYWHLRRRGVDVRYRMGVQAYPFAAHAWVEYRGRPINDVPEHVRRFRPIEGTDS